MGKLPGEAEAEQKKGARGMARIERPNSRAAWRAMAPLFMATAAMACACSPKDHPTSPVATPIVQGIVEFANHVPAVSANVILQSYRDFTSPTSPSGFYASTATDPSGAFSFSGMPPGNYELLAGVAKDKANFAPFDSLVDFASLNVGGTPGEPATRCRLTLRPASTVALRLGDALRGPSWVLLVGSSDPIGALTYLGDGRFLITGVPVGSWRLMAFTASLVGPPTLVYSAPCAVPAAGETVQAGLIQPPPGWPLSSRIAPLR